jgi:nuclear pore complex protein Nup155
MSPKAKENIRKAVETRSLTEKQNWLAESLRWVSPNDLWQQPLILGDSLFIKGARVLEFEKLREVCGDYQQLSYAKG